MMTVDEALNIAVIHTLSIKHGIAVSEAAEAASILAAEVRRLRDEVNGLTGSLDRAEKALKEEQEPVAFWWIGPDGKDNGGPYRGKPSDSAIDNARNMGCEPVLLYARPVPSAPAVAVPAVPDATCKQCLQVDRELREVIAGLVAIAEKKGKRQGSPNHCHQRPGIWDDDNGDLAGKPCSECAIYDRARALLQSTGDKK